MPGEGRKPTTPQNDGGIAQAAAGVGAGADRQHVGGQRHGRAAGRAAGVEHRIERIARRAPHRVAAVRARAEFRHVGLADDDGAGGAHAADHDVVVGRHEVAIERRAVGGEKVLGLLEVLDAGRQAVQQRQVLAAPDGGLGGLGFLARAIDAHRGHGVHRGIDPLDALQARLEQFDGRDFLGADAPAHLHGREREQVFVGHSSPSVGVRA